MERIFLGIPVLNRFDLLEQAIEALDYPNVELFIVNNNTLDAENQKQFERLKEKYQFDSFSPRYNLGVAGSWNRIMTTAWSRGYEFAYIGSNDTFLSPGTLKAVVEMQKPEPEVLWLVNYFNFWCFRLAAVPKVGLFDENFMPAYYEDNDFHHRISLAGLETLQLRESAFEHNGRVVPAVQSRHLGSQTINSDADYAAHNSNTFSNGNRAHFVTKWGSVPGHEKFKTPFNIADKDHRWWPDPAGHAAARDWDNERRREQQNKGPLCELSRKYRRTDKETVHCFLSKIYEPLFLYGRDQIRKVLEIGIAGGDSLRLWRDFFPNAHITGIDIQAFPELENQERITALCTNAYAAEFIAALPADFDLLIDDGPHTLDTMRVFMSQYAQKLAPGGWLVLEDIQSQDWIPVLLESLPPEMRSTAAVYDLRPHRGRYDDLAIVARRPA